MGRADQAAGDFRPYSAPALGPEDGFMQVDVLTAFIVAAAVAVAVLLAVVAGKLSARVFFDASGRKADEERR